MACGGLPHPTGARPRADVSPIYIPARWAFRGAHADDCQGRVPLCPRRLRPLTQGRQGNMDEVHTPERAGIRLM